MGPRELLSQLPLRIFYFALAFGNADPVGSSPAKEIFRSPAERAMHPMPIPPEGLICISKSDSSRLIPQLKRAVQRRSARILASLRGRPKG